MEGSRLGCQGISLNLNERRQLSHRHKFELNRKLNWRTHTFDPQTIHKRAGHYLGSQLPPMA